MRVDKVLTYMKGRKRSRVKRVLINPFTFSIHCEQSWDF